MAAVDSRARATITTITTIKLPLCELTKCYEPGIRPAVTRTQVNDAPRTSGLACPCATWPPGRLGEDRQPPRRTPSHCPRLLGLHASKHQRRRKDGMASLLAMYIPFCFETALHRRSPKPDGSLSQTGSLHVRFLWRLFMAISSSLHMLLPSWLHSLLGIARPGMRLSR
ncbi:uncharacterized protein EI97DRAFT_270764 [Westerdykella ornata]|uniref:Uncharacterized protein n=1 Tax=Westerdykella ornata TaxID=318751 RepID=A0A6A6JNK1_WESOR|nr:uncharacterized protein EI97DRAFT_270764 [Westerdykella ornata]KAF2277703.1 hypothetical protein EI97DRAFT_270764 [Westerdykella ornata]